MKKQIKTFTLCLSALAISLLFASSAYSQQAAAHHRTTAMAAAASNPNKMILKGLNAIVANQAAFGQTPYNNPMLAEINAIIQKHSGAQVTLSNHGPGEVQVRKADGTTSTLFPGASLVITVTANQTNLIAPNNFANIQLKNNSTTNCKFWDGDDQQFTALVSTSPNLGIILGRGLNHYYLKK